MGPEQGTPGFKGVLSLEETYSISLVYEFIGFQQYKWWQVSISAF